MLVAFSLATTLLAHGGQYRGPSDVKPPAPGGNSPAGGPTKGGGGGSAGPSGPSSSSGGSSSPSPSGTRGPSKARGLALGDDLGRWEFWWEFTKDPYLRLRDQLFVQVQAPEDGFVARGGRLRPAVARPRPEDLDRVARALHAAAAANEQRDLETGCLVALAKIGRDQPEWRVADLMLPKLAAHDQEMRETAALALGIHGNADAATIALLGDLVADAPAARARSGGAAVNERTRSFAAFAIGLLLARNPQPAAAVALCAPLLAVLAAPREHGRELKVAVVEALGQFPVASHHDGLRARAVDALGAYYLQDLGAGERLLQAHVPPALSRLLGHDDPAAARWREVFATDLRAGLAATRSGFEQVRGADPYLAQSCVLALGKMCRPWQDDASPDAAVAQLLLTTYRDHRDEQTRSFALLALANAGGARVRDWLLREMDRAKAVLEKPWCAMALGVLSARRAQADVAAGRVPDLDPVVAAALANAFAAARTPAAISAVGLAVGLVGDASAAPSLRSALAEYTHQDDVAGYLALALGLLRDKDAVPQLRDLLRDAHRRPFVMMQCARALGLLGDHATADMLCQELATGDTSLVRLSAIAQAVGQIGDRRSLEPLLRMLADDRLTGITRAFAAVALGTVCDKDPLPWNANYASHTNYRAATDTLTDGQSGILDIL
jgi:hypothetical protein